jgi:hypothetical protein
LWGRKRVEKKIEEKLDFWLYYEAYILNFFAANLKLKFYDILPFSKKKETPFFRAVFGQQREGSGDINAWEELNSK